MAALETAAGADSRQGDSPSIWVELLLAGAILLLAGFLRMAAPGLTEFKADEARRTEQVVEIPADEYA